MGVGFGYVGSFIAIGITMVFEGRSAAFIFICWAASFW